MSTYSLIRTGRTPDKKPVYDLRIDGILRGRRLLMKEAMRIIREFEKSLMERGEKE